MRKIDGGLLQKSLKRLGVSDQVAAAETLELFKQWLKQEFGNGVLNEVEARWVRRGSLGVKVDNAALRAGIKDREKKLLEYINQAKEKVVVKRIRFLI